MDHPSRETPGPPPGEALKRTRLLAALVAALAMLGACGWAGRAPAPPSAAEQDTQPTAPPAGEPTLQPEGLVDLTVYFRAGEGPGTHLAPTAREVDVGDDLPLRALELLVAGPGPDDERELRPPLPTTTRVRSFSIDGGTAHVDLTAAVITDARLVGASSVNEALALGALANTLTEFPAIDRVRLTVEGAATGRVGSVDVGGFWGGWGLPDPLVRDESLIGPAAENEAIVGVERFIDAEQATGSRDAGPVQVTSLRVRNRITYLRLVVEIADADEPGTTAKVPPARVRQRDGALVIDVSGVSDYVADLQPGTTLDAGEAGFADLHVEPLANGGQLRIVLRPMEPRPFWLHTLDNPTRIVLDVKKAGAPAIEQGPPTPSPSPTAD